MLLIPGIFVIHKAKIYGVSVHTNSVYDLNAGREIKTVCHRNYPTTNFRQNCINQLFVRLIDKFSLLQASVDDVATTAYEKLKYDAKVAAQGDIQFRVFDVFEHHCR